MREKKRLVAVEAVNVSVGSGATGHTVHRHHCVLFFSDIRGFTSYSGIRDPVTVVETLNRILPLQAVIIRRAGGGVAKFVGDEVMLFSPKHYWLLKLPLRFKKQCQRGMMNLTSFQLVKGKEVTIRTYVRKSRRRN